MVLGAVIFDTIYSKTLDIASGFVFLVMAVFYVVSAVLLVSVTSVLLSHKCTKS